VNSRRPVDIVTEWDDARTSTNGDAKTGQFGGNDVLKIAAHAEAQRRGGETNLRVSVLLRESRNPKPFQYGFAKRVCGRSAMMLAAVMWLLAAPALAADEAAITLLRERTRAGMVRVMGPLPESVRGIGTAPPVTVVEKETVSRNGYRRITVQYDADGTGHVAADLYLPDDLKAGEKRAAIVALHPTGPLGKRIVAGEGPRANRNYADELAQRGYVVLAPDYPSFGDLTDYDFSKDAYESGTMKGIVNHMAGVSLLAARAEVDPDRIGTIGHSLGGHNALFLSAFDSRVKATITSCGWTPFADYYGGNLKGWTSDRYMPRIRDDFGLDPARVPFDFPGILALIAPRPLLSISPEKDDNFEVRGVRRVESGTVALWKTLGDPAAVRFDYPACGHDFPPEVRRRAYTFLDTHLRHTPSRDVPVP
jgi:dienelactone hydrolase